MVRPFLWDLCGGTRRSAITADYCTGSNQQLSNQHSDAERIPIMISQARTVIGLFVNLCIRQPGDQPFELARIKIWPDHRFSLSADNHQHRRIAEARTSLFDPIATGIGIIGQDDDRRKVAQTLDTLQGTRVPGRFAIHTDRHGICQRIGKIQHPCRPSSQVAQIDILLSALVLMHVHQCGGFQEIFSQSRTGRRCGNQRQRCPFRKQLVHYGSSHCFQFSKESRVKIECNQHRDICRKPFNYFG